MRTQEYNVGIYCRLSVDDGTNNESMSIGNQKDMLSEYVRKQGWNIEEIYVDDGWSGVNFERPSFKRMIEDVERGRINLVIVKDLSRLGRNYILCGQFTEIYFPERNVRFIALNDAIDSLHSNNDIAPFKNILNDMYAKDISVKVKSSLSAKARRGEFLGSTAPYGYLRDPKDKHHLIINPEVAPIVKRIYDLSAMGYGQRKIANVLNSEGLYSPNDYYRFCQHDPVDGEFETKHIWRMKSVRDILINQLYLGHMVQCRKRSQSYRTQKIVWNPQDEWVVVKNTHEPIISEELFDRVQKAIAGRTVTIKKNGGDEPQIFSGLIYCKACGRRITHHTRKGKYGDYFNCGLYREQGSKACSSHYITFEHLSEIVFRDIKSNIELVQSDETEAIKRIVKSKCKDEERRLSEAKKELVKMKKRQSELDVRIKKVYEDNVIGKLPDNLFHTFLQDYETEKLTVKNSIHDLDETIRTIEDAKTDVSQFISLLKQYADITELNRQILMALVNKITIDETVISPRNREQTIEIDYKFAGIL